MPSLRGGLVGGEEVGDGDACEPDAVAGLVCAVNVVKAFFGEYAEVTAGEGGDGGVCSGTCCDAVGVGPGASAVGACVECDVVTPWSCGE